MNSMNTAKIPRAKSSDALSGSEKRATHSSRSGVDVIAEAMRKGKPKSDSRFYSDDDALSNSSHSLNNSSHGVSEALGCSIHSHGSENDLSNLDGSESGKTSRVLLPRFADQNKVSSKQRFTSESKDQFKLHRTTPSGRKLD